MYDIVLFIAAHFIMSNDIAEPVYSVGSSPDNIIVI